MNFLTVHCSKSSAAQLSGFPHVYTSMKPRYDNDASQRRRFPVPGQKPFGKPIAMSIHQCILDTSEREKIKIINFVINSLCKVCERVPKVIETGVFGLNSCVT